VRRVIAAALAILSLAAPSAAAQAVLFSERAIRAMPPRYSDPPCDLKGTHWRTKAAIGKLKAALEEADTATRGRELEKGRAVQLKAIEKNGQSRSSTAWFTLARIYLYLGDLLGADSALARAATISPQCAGTFDDLRHRVWLPLITAASDFAKAEANDSALALFRQAAAIDPRNPQAALGAGVILANAGDADSAIAYFQAAAHAADRAQMAEIRDQAIRNLGFVLQRANRHPEAIAALERYLASHADDMEVKRALAVSYYETGETAKAKPLDAELLDSADPMRLGLTYYSEKKWPEAARAFELAVAAAPYDREALYALANTYLAQGDGPRLVTVAKRLAMTEPLSVEALTMLGTGYRQTSQEAEALEAVEQLFALPVDLVMRPMTTSSDSTAALTGTVTGRPAQTVHGKPLAPRRLSLLFEFLDGGGRTVASSPAEIPALEPGQSQEIAVEARARGIAAWRYSITAASDSRTTGTTATR
jgi:tetratricopeptide (TPR) repeat protein